MADDGTVHFALKATVKDLNGLSTTVGGEFVDVKKLLDKSDGVISTSEPGEIAAFSGIDALKQVPASKVAAEKKAVAKRAAAPNDAGGSAGDDAGGSAGEEN